MVMTNDELFDDLKQFINTKIDGVESRLGNRIDGVESSLNRLEDEIQEVKETQHEILDTIGGEVVVMQKVQDNHEVRITKLEAKAA